MGSENLENPGVKNKVQLVPLIPTAPAVPVCNTSAFIACFILFLSNAMENSLFEEAGEDLEGKLSLENFPEAGSALINKPWEGSSGVQPMAHVSRNRGCGRGNAGPWSAGPAEAPARPAPAWAGAVWDCALLEHSKCPGLLRFVFKLSQFGPGEERRI